MEPLTVDDDICILKHETAYGVAGESPVSVCAGDESVASHFALLFRPEAPPSEGPQYMNKAFSAYRGIYIEKEDLQLELNKLLQADLERVTLENSKLLERCGEPHDLNGPDSDQDSDVAYNIRERGMQQMYQVLCGEISRLHTELKHQSRLVRQLRPLLNDNRPGAATVPVQCLDDVETTTNNNHHQRRRQHPPVLRVSVPRAPPPPPPTTTSSGSSTTGGPCPAPSGPPMLDGLREDCWYNGPWPGHPSAASVATAATAGAAAPAGAPPGAGDPCSVLLPPPPLNRLWEARIVRKLRKCKPPSFD
ncbi:hypothetical protein CRUP_003536 [Coryphaenoides rupestris]|nr:hypothetical protein CRUP_003536 [Coryphaenoides rupestris]